MSLSKKLLFAFIITGAFFLLLEGACRLFVFPGSYDYIERRAIEQGLLQSKAVGEFRIFLFGESTMFGGSLYPYSTIDKWMDMYLADLLPPDIARRVTITNFGRLGVSSRFVANAFFELTPYKPDLAVFYTVHNDFIQVEHRNALIHGVSARKARKEFFETFPKKSAFLNLLNRIVIKSKIAKNKLRDAKLKKVDDWYQEIEEGGGLYKNDANLLKPYSREYVLVKDNFYKNVNRIIETGRKKAIPVVFMEGVAKWKGFEPVRPVHDNALQGERLAKWEKIAAMAQAAFKDARYADALSLYERCLKLDPDYALTSYRMAQCYEALGRYAEANKYYSTSNDNDHFPIRAPSCANEYYEDIRLSGRKGVSVIRTRELLEANSPNGIIGDSLIMDQIHPNIRAQALMALEIVKTIYEAGLIAPKEKWDWNKLETFEEMEKRLGLDDDAMYDIYLATAGYVVKDYPQAAGFIEKAVALRPKSVFARSWLAWSYYMALEKEKAAAIYKELYNEVPDKAKRFVDPATYLPKR